MIPPRTSLIAASIAVFVVAGCAATPVAPATPITVSSPNLATPIPTPVPVSSATPTATPPVDEGNVDGDVYPELAVEAIDASTLRLTLDDPAAKAWRLVIAGTGGLAFDRLEIEVVTSDVAPLITAREIRDSEVVSEMDLSAFVDRTAAAGGCHATLGVCIGSDGFRLPHKGNGRFAMRLDILDAAGPLTITGGTAGWPGEPFVLGPWANTDPFTWLP